MIVEKNGQIYIHEYFTLRGQIEHSNKKEVKNICEIISYSIFLHHNNKSNFIKAFLDLLEIIILLILFQKVINCKVNHVCIISNYSVKYTFLYLLIY